MNEEQKNYGRVTQERNALLGILASAFYFGFALVGLISKEIIDTSYDGGGLGYLVIFIFVVPPFFVMSIISIFMLIKFKSSGNKIGAVLILRAAAFALIGLIATVVSVSAMLYGERVWDSFFK